MPLAVARGRKLSKPRPRQGARLAAFRQAAGLTQAELAQVLGVRVEALLGEPLPRLRRADPVGKAQKLFEEVSTLPRRQQERILETVSALVAQYKRGA